MRRRMFAHSAPEDWGRHHGGFGPFGHGHLPFPPPGPPFPPGAWGFRGRGRGRRGRGNVRAAILALLAERPMHGYEMIQELENRTGGIWRPSPGSIYPTLQLLEDEDLIAGEEVEGRKRFTLTDAGRAEVERQGQHAPWEEATAGIAPAAFGLRDAIAQLAEAAWTVGTAGTEAQQTRALEILTESRRRLYAILAEDGGSDDAEAEEDEPEA
jgi:DNA-binding PadR family transcriptional regulator